MSNIIKLFDSAPDQLRRVADWMDERPDLCKTVTVIWGDCVYQCSDEDEAKAARELVFNCTFAINKIMENRMGVLEVERDAT